MRKLSKGDGGSDEDINLYGESMFFGRFTQSSALSASSLNGPLPQCLWTFEKYQSEGREHYKNTAKNLLKRIDVLIAKKILGGKPQIGF